MKKENIIEFIMYRNHNRDIHNSPPVTISEELKNAIQLLILRLREQKPLQEIDR